VVIRDFAALAQQWRDLEAADIPLAPLENRVGVDARSSGSGLTIRRGRNGWRSEIKELKDGRFAYILPVFIRRDRPGKTIIRDSWIDAPWPGATIELLEDPKDEERHPSYYNFPGDTERFVREKVLNHRMNCILSNGDIREGFVLAVGLGPPDTCKNHQEIEITFGVLDQWDCEPSAKLQMRINRLPVRSMPTYKSTRGPLLSRRDIIPPARSLVAPPVPTEESRKKDAEAIRRRFCKDMAAIHSKSKRAKIPVGPETG
jgi:hypothetical protein